MVDRVQLIIDTHLYQLPLSIIISDILVRVALDRPLHHKTKPIDYPP